MIVEYDFIVNVEIQSETEEEQNELIRQFKREMFSKYADNEIISVEGIKRYRGE